MRDQNNAMPQWLTKQIWRDSLCNFQDDKNYDKLFTFLTHFVTQQID